MRIAQVAPVYPPYHGGMGVVAKEYTERLRTLGHTVKVFTPRFHVGNAGWSPTMPFIGRSFDVVHLHYPFFGGAEPLTFCPFRSRTPLVLTYHMDAMAAGWKGGVFEAHRAFVQPFILERAAKVLVSSLDYAEHSGLAAYCKRHPDRVVVMPFGIDEVPVKPGAEKHTVLFVGTLDSAHAFKGLTELLEAWSEVNHVTDLIVVGDGNRRAIYEAKARAMGIENRVRFLGALSHEALEQCFENALVHVLASTSSAEAFGLVTLEAAAHGVPSIVSDLPGVRTLVRDGETGIVVPPGDRTTLAQALTQMLGDFARSKKMGEAARERVRSEYNWDRLMQKLVSIYEGVL